MSSLNRLMVDFENLKSHYLELLRSGRRNRVEVSNGHCLILVAHATSKETNSFGGCVGRENVLGDRIVRLDSGPVRMPVGIVYSSADEYRMGLYEEKGSRVNAIDRTMMRGCHDRRRQGFPKEAIYTVPPLRFRVARY